MLREGVAWRETLRSIRVAVAGATEMVTVLRESRKRTRMKTLLRPSTSGGQAGGEAAIEEEGN